jgi:Na+/proline symporter
VTQGSALVVSAVTPFSYTTALFAVWFGYTVFTVYAGSRGVVITDTMMFLFFSVVALLALAFVVSANGGWFDTVQQLATTSSRAGIIGAEGYLGPGRNWATTFDMWTWTGILGFAWGVVFAISPWQSSRYLMARDEHVVIRSGLATAIVLSVFWPVIYFAGGAIVLANADIRPMADAMIWAAQNLMPVLVGSLLLAGIVSAGLSSASTFLTLVGFAITNDLVDASQRNDKQNLLISRAAILGVGLAALGVALVAPPSIFWITNFVGPSFAASWGPLAFMSVWSKRITEAGAFWGMVVGFLGCVVPKALVTANLVALPVALDPIVIGTAASILTIVLVSRAGVVTEAEQGFREQLHVAPAELADVTRKHGTLLWPKLLIIWGVVTMAGLVVVYVRPYQLATGLLEPGGTYVTLSGELIAALTFGLTLIAGGVFAHAAVKRFLA